VFVILTERALFWLTPPLPQWHSIPMDNAHADADKMYPEAFEVATTRQSLHFRCRSPVIANRWVDLIRNAAEQQTANLLLESAEVVMSDRLEVNYQTPAVALIAMESTQQSMDRYRRKTEASERRAAGAGGAAAPVSSGSAAAVVAGSPSGGARAPSTEDAVTAGFSRLVTMYARGPRGQMSLLGRDLPPVTHLNAAFASVFAVPDDATTAALLGYGPGAAGPGYPQRGHASSHSRTVSFAGGGAGGFGSGGTASGDGSGGGPAGYSIAGRYDPTHGMRLSAEAGLSSAVGLAARQLVVGAAQLHPILVEASILAGCPAIDLVRAVLHLRRVSGATTGRLAVLRLQLRQAVAGMLLRRAAIKRAARAAAATAAAAAVRGTYARQSSSGGVAGGSGASMRPSADSRLVGLSASRHSGVSGSARGGSWEGVDAAAAAATSAGVRSGAAASGSGRSDSHSRWSTTSSRSGHIADLRADRRTSSGGGGGALAGQPTAGRSRASLDRAVAAPSARDAQHSAALRAGQTADAEEPVGATGAASDAATHSTLSSERGNLHSSSMADFMALGSAAAEAGSSGDVHGLGAADEMPAVETPSNGAAHDSGASSAGSGVPKRGSGTVATLTQHVAPAGPARSPEDSGDWHVGPLDSFAGASPDRAHPARPGVQSATRRALDPIAEQRGQHQPQSLDSEAGTAQPSADTSQVTAASPNPADDQLVVVTRRHLGLAQASPSSVADGMSRNGSLSSIVAAYPGLGRAVSSSALERALSSASATAGRGSSQGGLQVVHAWSGASLGRHAETGSAVPAPQGGAPDDTGTIPLPRGLRRVSSSEAPALSDRERLSGSVTSPYVVIRSESAGSEHDDSNGAASSDSGGAGDKPTPPQPGFPVTTESIAEPVPPPDAAVVHDAMPELPQSPHAGPFPTRGIDRVDGSSREQRTYDTVASVGSGAAAVAVSGGGANHVVGGAASDGDGSGELLRDALSVPHMLRTGATLGATLAEALLGGAGSCAGDRRTDE